MDKYLIQPRFKKTSILNFFSTGLDVRYNNITDEGVGHLAEILQEDGSALRSLDLRFNDIQADGAEVLAKSLQCNSSLRSLRLSGNKIMNRGAMQLASMLQVNGSLQELQLASCDLATQSVIAFAIVLKSNKTLRSVDISRPLLFSQQEEWAVHFSEMLAVNSSLVELHLGTMGMTDTGMERLTDGLRLNNSLRYLDLRCNRVTRDGVRHLAEVLKQHPTLEIIDLSSNRIEDEGAVYLSEAVAWPGCVLRELSVSRNNIRTEGLLSLAQAMKVNTTLNHIYIWGNQLEEPVCQAFRQLIASGRLLPDQTDVSAYEVDGQVFLSEVFHSLRRHYYKTNSSTTDTPPPPPPPPTLPQTSKREGKMSTAPGHAFVLPSFSDLPPLAAQTRRNRNNIRTEGLLSLAQAMKVNTTLNHIKIWGNQLEEPVFQAFRQLIASGRLLPDQTDVSAYEVDAKREGKMSTAPGHAFVLPSFSDLPPLAAQTRRKNYIRTEGLLSLAQAMKVNTTLNHIKIWGNQLEEPVFQAFRQLIASGRLLPDQTDVSAYEVDGQVFLSEVFHSLRRHYYKTNSSTTDTPPTSNTATDLLTDGTAPFLPHIECEQLVLLQP
ncbi:LOW QUALITY PROTEIN: leucine-rich repeat-containing protein 34 [Symphorus nematophorus]